MMTKNPPAAAKPEAQKPVQQQAAPPRKPLFQNPFAKKPVVVASTTTTSQKATTIGKVEESAANAAQVQSNPANDGNQATVATDDTRTEQVPEDSFKVAVDNTLPAPSHVEVVEEPRASPSSQLESQPILVSEPTIVKVESVDFDEYDFDNE